MIEQHETVGDDDAVWRVGVFDAHCHPTDIMASIEDIAKMKARALTIMASRSQDQELVAAVASKFPLERRSELFESSSTYIIPAFGWHPWFSHQIFDDRRPDGNIECSEHYKLVLSPPPHDEDFINSLPTPLALSKYLVATEARLRRHPFALVGEVGLDRAFRLPVGPFLAPEQASESTGVHLDEEYTPGSREGRALSPYRVSMEHQKLILRAQLELAARLGRPVSVHSVQTHGVVFNLLQSMWRGHEKLSKRQQKRRMSVTNAHTDGEDEEAQQDAAPSLPFPPRICMHSYSGPADPLKQFFNPTVPAEIYFSFSDVINFATPSTAKVVEVIKAVPDSRILVESDYHCAGNKMDKLLLSMVKRVCEIKEWDLEQGARQIAQNWANFIFGDINGH